jgi:hypothetical protein
MSVAGSSSGRWGLSLPWWSVALATLTTVGLALLAFAILVLDAFTYGTVDVFDPGAIDPPIVDRYRLAFAVGAGINLFGAIALSRLALRTPAATWPPILAALPIALVTGAIAVVAMLATLGIDLV